MLFRNSYQIANTNTLALAAPLLFPSTPPLRTPSNPLFSHKVRHPHTPTCPYNSSASPCHQGGHMASQHTQPTIVPAKQNAPSRPALFSLSFLPLSLSLSLSQPAHLVPSVMDHGNPATWEWELGIETRRHHNIAIQLFSRLDVRMSSAGARGPKGQDLNFSPELGRHALSRS
ncbi:hypothetical protein SODALDRAFT_174403 [Sodiomyces alkalinus F11]|uniref:Uncharacterized protein n=1 Tax=Sodiomyces alkalinus (strain CBS 110278 / VKM F-3762 / F11) TaxID=1314773 RepID=A0A3N2PTH3_SODAK|nr:hypothetical protein SODALDRAFT_174403 [Sodiomyces alkalinus F11]ROT37788.1 hypothetical protein SODALDRAFT_174403 [Sodiomyces alkalinus F11]